MDFKRYEIEKIIFIIVFFVFPFLFVCCFIFDNDVKGELVKSITMDENYLLTIVLDNSNHKKKIGNVYNIELNGCVRLGVDEVRETKTEITVSKEIINCRDCFYDNEECKFKIAWPGGRILVTTIYKDGQFTILKESYVNRI